MRSLNHCTFIGNLGQAPELKHTAGGTAVCKFSIALNKKWKDGKGETQEKTTWVNMIVWEQLAEVCAKYLTKGALVHVRAEYDLNVYKGEDGVEKQKPQFVVQEIRFLSGAKPGETDSDIPF